MRKFKQDNYNGNGDYGDMFATVWATAAVTAGDWAAIQINNATSPAALEGFSFRQADADNADAKDGTVGIFTTTTTAAGYVQVQIGGYYSVANVAAGVAIGDTLVISTTGGRAETVAAQGWPFRIIGRALAAASSNTAPVDIYPHPMFLT